MTVRHAEGVFRNGPNQTRNGVPVENSVPEVAEQDDVSRDRNYIASQPIKRPVRDGSIVHRIDLKQAIA